MNIIKFVTINRVRLRYAMNFFNVFGMPLLVSDVIYRYTSIPIYITFTVGLIGLIVCGWFMDKLGMIQEEMSFLGKRNDEFIKLKELIKNR